LGAREIPRSEFTELLTRFTLEPGISDWTQLA